MKKCSASERIDAVVVRKLFSSLRRCAHAVEENLIVASDDLPHPLTRSEPDEESAPGGLRNGWQIAPYDPNRLLRRCKHIKLRDGFTLASYQLVEGGNGNGLALVIPTQERLPEPAVGDFEMEWDGAKPVITMSGEAAPAWLRADIDAFLEGDGSAMSYLEASLFIREIRELGSMWHGCYWATHDLLVKPMPRGKRAWKWTGRKPTDWRPLVRRKATRTRRRIHRPFCEADGYGPGFDRFAAIERKGASRAYSCVYPANNAFSQGQDTAIGRPFVHASTGCFEFLADEPAISRLARTLYLRYLEELGRGHPRFLERRSTCVLSAEDLAPVGVGNVPGGQQWLQELPAWTTDAAPQSAFWSVRVAQGQAGRYASHTQVSVRHRPGCDPFPTWLRLGSGCNPP